jgi:hypothetical protein
VFPHRFSCGWRCCAAGASVQVGEKARGKSRLEAFSDGVIAIIITIMVLELKVPHSSMQINQRCNSCPSHQGRDIAIRYSINIP